MSITHAIERLARVFALLNPSRQKRMFLLRRRDAPWEVVDTKEVQPVPTFYDDEDVNIVSLSENETRGTYVFDLNKLRGASSDADSLDWRKALVFARQRLLEEVQKRDYNCLLIEGWCITVLRRGKQHRLQIEYNGRGALANGKLEVRDPPFIELLGAA